MRKLFAVIIIILAFAVNAAADQAKEHTDKNPIGKIWFSEPKDGAKVKNPVNFCFAEKDLKVVEWQKDHVMGQGHHHLLIDIDFPTTPNYKNIKNPLLIVHYKKNCKTLRKPLSKGKHTIRGFFTHNNHQPYLPIIGQTITIEVVE